MKSLFSPKWRTSVLQKKRRKKEQISLDFMKEKLIFEDLENRCDLFAQQ